MKMRRGQSALVGFTLITLIILVTVAASFVWGQDIIERSVNANDLARVESQMIALHNAIEEVANEHSQRTVSFTIADGWLFAPNNKSIIYQSFNPLPEVILYNEGRLIIGNSSSVGPCINSSHNLGDLGYDEPGCLFQKAGNFELNYIQLNDSANLECLGIILNPTGNAGATRGDHKILLTYNETTTAASLNCTTVKYSVVNIRIE